MVWLCCGRKSWSSWVEGVSGRECKARDRAQISSSQQVSGEVETCVKFFMASEKVAPEHCKDYNVAGFSLELERLDDCQSPKRQNCELECENGGKRDWSKETTLDGNGPVVETLAQDGPPMDREVQHERSERVLSWAGHVARLDYKEICANALRCRGLQRWRWRQLALERNGERRMVWPTPTAFQNIQVGGHGGGGGFQVHWKRRRVFGISSGIHGIFESCSRPWTLETVLEIWKKPRVDEAKCLGDPSASGMAWTGAGATWKLWRRMVSV